MICFIFRKWSLGLSWLNGSHSCFLEWLKYCPDSASCLRQSLFVSYFTCNQEGWLTYSEFWKKNLTYQADMYQARLTDASTLSVLNHVAPPFLKPISMNSRGAEGLRALMCCFFLVCSRLPCSPLSTSASFPLLCTEGWPCARQDAVQGIGGQYESASITLLLPVATASEGSARFHSSLLPGCALHCCRRDALMPRDPCSPSPCRCSRCFSGQLGSWTWSAHDSPCSPQVLPPASSPAMTLSRGFCSSSHGLPSVCQKWPFPSISEPGVCGFPAGRMRGLLHACPFPLGNCYSFHFSRIQSDHLSGVLLGKCSAKPVCSNLHL